MSLKVEPAPVIYVTGFGPFGKHVQNASQVVIELLHLTDIEEDLNVKILTDVLPVSYEKVYKTVPNMWETLHPKLVVHIGVSDEAKCIQLETQAFNAHYCQLDINGCLPNSKECVKENPLVLETNLDLKKAVHELNEIDSVIKFALSNDPGRYLCGFVYYTSLNIDSKRSVFIHIPPLSKVSCDFNEASKTLVNAISLVIKALYKQVEEMNLTDTVQ